MTCKQILIVEDDNDIRESLSELLGVEGYSTFSAINGLDALEKLRASSQPCLILLDMMMPVMDGWELLGKLKADLALRVNPVVIVSAAGQRAAETPADGYLKKPIDVDQLLETVAFYCEKESG